MNAILLDVEHYIRRFFLEEMPLIYVFHNLEHTENVVKGCARLGEANNVTQEELEILLLAAWFHDTGYSEGAEGHEERSIQRATKYLSERNYPKEKIETIGNCIRATRLPQTPKNLLEEIIADADLSHLGKKSYWKSCDMIRLEFAVVKDMVMTDEEWVDFEIDFLSNHRFHNKQAQLLFGQRQSKNLAKLYEFKNQISDALEGKPFKENKNKKKKKNKNKNRNSNEIFLEPQSGKKMYDSNKFGRGVETMFRTTYRTHVNLSAMADNKANIMLSINAIVLSIVVSSLVPQFAGNPKLIIPTGILMLVCLISIVYATLATRPKVTKGTVTREDIRNRKANLLFFGNFYNMDLKDYEWGMEQMIMDSYFQYVTMARDIYWLGKVLAKKYRYLSICYTIFMYGMITAVASYVIAYLI